jgi:hypothetical protein
MSVMPGRKKPISQDDIPNIIQVAFHIINTFSCNAIFDSQDESLKEEGEEVFHCGLALILQKQVNTI